MIGECNMKKKGFTLIELLDDLITIGIKNYKNKEKKTTTFETNILSSFNGVKGVKGLKGAKKF